MPLLMSSKKLRLKIALLSLKRQSRPSQLRSHQLKSLSQRMKYLASLTRQRSLKTKSLPLLRLNPNKKKTKRYLRQNLYRKPTRIRYLKPMLLRQNLSKKRTRKVKRSRALNQLATVWLVLKLQIWTSLPTPLLTSLAWTMLKKMIKLRTWEPILLSHLKSVNIF